MPDILVSVSAGLFGLLGAGLSGGAAGALLWRKRSPGFPPTAGFVALIPAYQEERNLPVTLDSLSGSAKEAGVSLRVVVGADSCSDRTEEIARAAGAEVIRVFHHSKWKTLVSLVAASKPGEWVALVDAGAVWPRTLLADLADDFRDDSLLAIAPAYYPRGASWQERLFWKIEAFWKTFENFGGGPISVHGATIFYRAEALKAALKRVEGFGRESWLNDDVTLPLAARLAFPGGAVRYWCPRNTSRRVSDVGLSEAGTQLRRRQRMIAGNLEWALTLFPASLWASPAAGFVAIRRVLRIFWAYWVLALLYAPFFALFSSRDTALLATAAAMLTGALVLVAAGKTSLVEALAASLGAPFQLPAVLSGRTGMWS